MISGCGRCTRLASPGAGSESSTKVSPFTSIAGPPAKVPTRSFGPCRSTRIPIGRPCSLSIARIAATSSRMRACVVWLMLMRKTSAPARNRFAIAVLSEDAGPSVATILVRRRRRIRALSVRESSRLHTAFCAEWNDGRPTPEPGFPSPRERSERWGGVRGGGPFDGMARRNAIIRRQPPTPAGNARRPSPPLASLAGGG